MHALIRETLYGELSSPRRVRLHGRVAEAIERMTADRPVVPLADLAFTSHRPHRPALSTKRSTTRSRAGDLAADALAHEEAARLFGMALMSLEFKPTTPETDRLHVDLHTRRARSFDALGEWALEARELDAALRHLDPRRSSDAAKSCCRSRAPVPAARSPAGGTVGGRSEAAGRASPSADLEANAIAWLARCQQANGDLEAAITMDRRAIALAPGVITAAHMMGPLTLYLAGRSSEGLALACEGADAARSSRDTMFIMYSLSHLGLNLTAAGRYAEATAAFNDARSFGRKYGGSDAGSRDRHGGGTSLERLRFPGRRGAPIRSAGPGQERRVRSADRQREHRRVAGPRPEPRSRTGRTLLEETAAAATAPGVGTSGCGGYV